VLPIVASMDPLFNRGLISLSSHIVLSAVY